MQPFTTNNKQIQQQPLANNKYIDIFSCADQTINLFDQLLSQSYAKSIQFKNLEEDLAKFFDGLIWAQKKNPLLVYQIFEMKALNQIVQKFVGSFPLVLLRGSILLIGNCEPFGLVAEQILDSFYPNFLMEHIFCQAVLQNNKQQIEEYIGNFLKCYHRLFKIDWLSKFILSENIFQLLEINMKFFNCIEFLSRTSGLNIVLNLLQYPEVRCWISNCSQRSKFYYSIFDSMTKLFRNELAQFGLRIGHISHEDNVDLILRQLEDKIALWEDISANCSGIEKFIQQSFYSNVILPLILGPLQSNQKPLFTLKFSLFVSKKMLPILKNFGILDKYIKALFFEQTITYDPNTLNKAIIQPFRLSKLLSTNIYEQEDDSDDQREQKAVKRFYETLFASKDNHFILMINQLQTALFNTVNKTEEEEIKGMGFSYGGKMYEKSGRRLIKQLMQVHRLSTIESILNTLVVISDHKYLDIELQNYFIQTFHSLIENIKKYLKSAEEVLQNFTQLIEYDIKMVDQIQFAKQQTSDKYQNLFKVVFVWDINKEDPHGNQFYSRIPESPAEFLRYNFIKFMLLRKAKQTLLESHGEIGLTQKYHQQIITKSPFITGDVYNENDLMGLIFPCEIMANKILRPVLFVKDDNFFVIAVTSKPNQLSIEEGMPIKHVSVEEIKKALRITLKEFCYQKCEMIIKKTITMKVKSQITDQIKSRIRVSINKHLALVGQILETTSNQIPETSFI